MPIPPPLGPPGAPIAPPPADTSGNTPHPTTNPPSQAPTTNPTPPNTSTTSPPGTDDTGTPPTEFQWPTNLSNEDKLVLEKKGFKDVPSLIDSYRNLEKLMGGGTEDLIKMPRDRNNADEMRAFYEKLGMPKEGKEYGEFAEGDAEINGWYQKIFHQMGLTQDQAKYFAKEYQSQVKNSAEHFQKESEAKFAQAKVKLEQEWGAAYQQNVALAQKTAQQLGVDATQVEALQGVLGVESTAKLFTNIGKASSEAQFVGTGESGQTRLSPGAAQARINELIADKGFQERLRSGDIASNHEWDTLNAMAAGMSP